LLNSFQRPVSISTGLVDFSLDFRLDIVFELGEGRKALRISVAKVIKPVVSATSENKLSH
jgi:hypothetical protein